jgi:hypothetical protein
MLKAPGTKRLKLKHHGPLSNVAFKFNLRRYTTALFALLCVTAVPTAVGRVQGLGLRV